MNDRFFQQRLTLTSAATRKELALAGDGLAVVQSSHPAVRITVTFDEPDGQAITLGRGSKLIGHAFRRVFLAWDAQPGQWIDLAAFTGIDFGPPLPIDDALSPVEDLASLSGGVWTTADATTSSTSLQTLYTVAAGNYFILERAYLGIASTSGGNAATLVINDAGGNTKVTMTARHTQIAPTWVNWRRWICGPGYTFKYKTDNASWQATAVINGWLF